MLLTIQSVLGSDALHACSLQFVHRSIPSAPAGGKPIPTTGRSGLAFQPSSSWPAWPHPEREETSAVWHGEVVCSYWSNSLLYFSYVTIF